eukprot:8778458-Pyramimonas_sp.AAC.1
MGWARQVQKPPQGWRARDALCRASPHPACSDDVDLGLGPPSWAILGPSRPSEGPPGAALGAVLRSCLRQPWGPGG